MWNGRNIVGISYAVELLPGDRQDDYITLMFLIGAFWMFISPLVYLFVTRNWLLLSVIGVILTIISSIVSFFYIPESPKWLYENNKFVETKQILKEIAFKNGI